MAPPPHHHHHHTQHHHQQNPHHSRNPHALPPLQTERDSKHEGGASFPSRWSRESHRRDEGPHHEPSSTSQPQQQLPSYSSYASLASGPAPTYQPPKTNPGSSNNSTSSTTPHANTNPAANNNIKSRRSASADTFRSEKSSSLQNLAPLSSHRYSSSSSQQQAQIGSTSSTVSSYRRNNPSNDEPPNSWDRTSRNPSRGGGGVGRYASHLSDADIPTSSSSSSWRGGRGSLSSFPLSSSSLSRRPMDRSESGAPTTTQPPPRIYSQRSNSPPQRFSGGGRGRGGSYHNPRSTSSTFINRSSGELTPQRDDNRRSTTDDQYDSFNSAKSTSSWSRYHQDSKDHTTGTSRYAPASSRNTDGSGTFRRSTSHDYQRTTSNSPPASRGPPHAAAQPPPRGGRGMLRDETPLVDAYPVSDVARHDANPSHPVGTDNNTRRWSSSLQPLAPFDDQDSKSNVQARNPIASTSELPVTTTASVDASYINSGHDDCPPSSQPTREERTSTFRSSGIGSPSASMFRPNETSAGSSGGWNQPRTIQSTASSESKEGGLVIEEGEERTTTTPRYNNQFVPETRSSFTRSADALPPQGEKPEPELSSNPYYQNNKGNDKRNSFNDDNSQGRLPFARSQWNRTNAVGGNDRALNSEEPRASTHYETTGTTRTFTDAGDATSAKPAGTSDGYSNHEDDFGRARRDDRVAERPSYYNNRDTNIRRTGEESTTSFGARRGGWLGSSTSRPYSQIQSDRTTAPPATALSSETDRPFRRRENTGVRSYDEDAADEWRRSTSPPFRSNSRTYEDDKNGVPARGGRGGAHFPRRQGFSGRGFSRSSDPEPERGTSGGLRWEPPPSVSTYTAPAEHDNDYPKRRREEVSNEYPDTTEYSKKSRVGDEKSRVGDGSASDAWLSSQPDDTYRESTGVGALHRASQMSRSDNYTSELREASLSDRTVKPEQSIYSHDRKIDGHTSYYSVAERHAGDGEGRDARRDRQVSGNDPDGESVIPRRSSPSSSSSWRMRPVDSIKSLDVSSSAAADRNVHASDVAHHDHSYARRFSDSNYHRNNSNAASEQDRASSISFDAGNRNHWTPPNTFTASNNYLPTPRNPEYAQVHTDRTRQQQFESSMAPDSSSSPTRAVEEEKQFPSSQLDRSIIKVDEYVPPPLPEETSIHGAAIKTEPIDVDAEATFEAPNVVHPSPPPSPSPPSGIFVATTRMIELQAQMEFSYAKYLKLLQEQEQLKAQFKFLETLPVGLDAIKDELETVLVKPEPKEEEVACDTMDET